MTKTYSLSLADARTYLFATAFVAGNLILPQLCHLIPQGGLIFLPIYFFTLIGAYRFGLNVGMLTALASPIINSAIFGMPPVAALPAIVVKSVCLAVAASMISKHYQKVSFPLVALAVVAYQAVGMTVEFFMDMNVMHALQDVIIGWPGILFQIVGGYSLLKYLERVNF